MKNTFLLILTLLLANIVQAQCHSSTHSNNPSDNWESCSSKVNPNSTRTNSHWIQYDLGYVYPITSTHFWNYNVFEETDKGFKDVSIDYSMDGETWTELGTFTFQEATGSNFYEGFSGPDFGNIGARYILITAVNNYGNTCYGLAECKFDIGEQIIVDGFEEMDEKSTDLVIYPNPTQDIVQLRYTDLEVEEVILRNALGFELQRYQGNIPKAMDVSSLPSGIYFLIVNMKDKKFLVKKFIKNEG